MSFIKKSPITRLLTFDNKKPISVFWSTQTRNWYVSNVIPRLKTSPNAFQFSANGFVDEPENYYKFTTCLNYISDCNKLELQHCNKCRFENNKEKTSFAYYLSTGERIVIPLLPNFTKTKIFFTLEGSEGKPAMILRVEK